MKVRSVKFEENTNIGYVIFTTSCKRESTAISRFEKSLSDYDSTFTESMIKAFMSIKPAGYVDGSLAWSGSSVVDNEYELHISYLDGTYSMTIYFLPTLLKPVEKSTPAIVWCICTQDGTIKDFLSRKELFEYAYKNNLFGDFNDIWIEEKELIDEKSNYYETVDYEELDLYKIRTCLELDICDMKVNSSENLVENNRTTENTKYTVSLGFLDDIPFTCLSFKWCHAPFDTVKACYNCALNQSCDTAVKYSYTTDNFQIVPAWVYSKYNINPVMTVALTRLFKALAYEIDEFGLKVRSYPVDIDGIIIIDDTFLSEEMPF